MNNELYTRLCNMQTMMKMEFDGDSIARMRLFKRVDLVRRL